MSPRERAADEWMRGVTRRRDPLGLSVPWRPTWLMVFTLSPLSVVNKKTFQRGPWQWMRTSQSRKPNGSFDFSSSHHCVSQAFQVYTIQTETENKVQVLQMWRHNGYVQVKILLKKTFRLKGNTHTCSCSGSALVTFTVRACVCVQAMRRANDTKKRSPFHPGVHRFKTSDVQQRVHAAANPRCS